MQVVPTYICYTWLCKLFNQFWVNLYPIFTAVIASATFGKVNFCHIYVAAWVCKSGLSHITPKGVSYLLNRQKAFDDSFAKPQ